MLTAPGASATVARRVCVDAVIACQVRTDAMIAHHVCPPCLPATARRVRALFVQLAGTSGRCPHACTSAPHRLVGSHALKVSCPGYQTYALIRSFARAGLCTGKVRPSCMRRPDARLASVCGNKGGDCSGLLSRKQLHARWHGSERIPAGTFPSRRVSGRSRVAGAPKASCRPARIPRFVRLRSLAVVHDL